MGPLAGVVILYYPDSNVLSNIDSYSMYLEKIYVYDNSEKRDEALASAVRSIPHAVYFHDGENKGIAARLNQAARQAVYENIRWLLTMDQDSFFNPENIQNYINCLSGYKDDGSVAVFGVEYEQTSQPAQANCDTVATNRLITSGSFLNLIIWSETAGFDELLFIDEVDLEYCYRTILAGYKVLKFSRVFLQHSLGQVSRHRSLKNFASTPRTLHTPLRMYYRVRNHLYIKNKYNAYFKDEMIISRRGLLHSIKNSLLYGKDRWRLSRFVFQAFLDFKKGRMGKKG